MLTIMSGEFGRESSEILYERNLRVFVGGTGSDKRMFSDI